MVRLLLHGEQVPLLHEFNGLPLDNQWVWVAEHEGEVVGALVGANLHGVLLLLRLLVKPGAPKTTALRLLRQAFKEAHARGLVGVMSCFDINDPVEMQLARMLEKSGQDMKFLPRAVLWGSGKLSMRFVH